MQDAFLDGKKCLLQLYVLLAFLILYLFFYFIFLAQAIIVRFVTSSNQGCNDAFTSCDFEHRIVFAYNQLNDVQWYVCGLQQHATCVKELCWKVLSRDLKNKNICFLLCKAAQFPSKTLCTCDVTFSISPNAFFLTL